jgi:hypothetical protein
MGSNFGIGVSGGDRGVPGERISFGVDVTAKSRRSEAGGDCAGGPERGEARSERVRAGGGGCAVESKMVKLTLSIQNALCNIFASLCGPYLERLVT